MRVWTRYNPHTLQIALPTNHTTNHTTNHHTNNNTTNHNTNHITNHTTNHITKGATPDRDNAPRDRGGAHPPLLHLWSWQWSKHYFQISTHTTNQPINKPYYQSHYQHPPPYRNRNKHR